FGYETMYLLHPRPGGMLDVDAIRGKLEGMGESVLVAGDSAALKIHVHNEHPDGVIAYGLSLGTLSRVSIANLDHQARDIRETRAAAFASSDSVSEGLPSRNGGDGPHPAGPVPAASDGVGPALPL